MPAQAPAVHTSPTVLGLLSLQAVPLPAAGLEQVPVAESHRPATWHWSDALHTTGVEPVHTPAWQVSLCVQALPSLQAVASLVAGLEQIPLAGWHVPAAWHWSLAVHTTGFEPMQRPAWQVSVCVQKL